MAARRKRDRNGRFVKRKRATTKRRARRTTTQRKRTTRRKRTTQRSPAPRARRRSTRRRTTTGIVTSLATAGAGIGTGLLLAGVAARAVPWANTTLKRALLVGGLGTLAYMQAPRLAKLPLLSRGFVQTAAAGMFADALWRGSSPWIGKAVPALAAGTRGLLGAGVRRRLYTRSVTSGDRLALVTQ